MFANPAYSPPSPAAETLALPRPGPLSRKSSMASIKATIVAKALPLLRNPLEALQQRRSSSVNPPAPLLEAEVRSLPRGEDRWRPLCSALSCRCILIKRSYLPGLAHPPL